MLEEVCDAHGIIHTIHKLRKQYNRQTPIFTGFFVSLASNEGHTCSHCAIFDNCGPLTMPSPDHDDNITTIMVVQNVCLSIKQRFTHVPWFNDDIKKACEKESNINKG